MSQGTNDYILVDSERNLIFQIKPRGFFEHKATYSVMQCCSSSSAFSIVVIKLLLKCLIQSKSGGIVKLQL